MNTPGGYVFATPEAQTIEINCVVFDDGTFEGDALAALRINAFIAGDRIQTKRVAVILKQTLDEQHASSSESISALIQRVAGLSDEVPDSVVDSLNRNAGSAKAANLAGTIQTTMAHIKKGLQEDIAAFQNSHQKSPSAKAFREWLTSTYEYYVQWRLRLR